MKKSKLRVFEAFAGIGAQRKALENLGIDHMDTGGFSYGAYKATEYAQKRVAKAYKDITGEDLP